MEISQKAKEMAELNNLSEEANQAYINLVDEQYADAKEAEENYQGEWPNDEDFVMNLLEECGDLPKLPPYVHIDTEATARDVMYDYQEDNGHYFRNT